MRTCPSCGARVADDLAWCNQCYAELPAAQAPTAKAPAAKAPAAAAAIADPADAQRPLWVRSNIGQPDVKIAPEFSRWRGGATSFGPIGRILLTLGVIVMLIVGYPLLRGLMYSVGGMDVPGHRIHPAVRVRRDPGRRLHAEPRLEARTDQLTRRALSVFFEGAEAARCASGSRGSPRTDARGRSRARTPA